MEGFALLKRRFKYGLVGLTLMMPLGWFFSSKNRKRASTTEKAGIFSACKYAYHDFKKAFK